MNRRLWEKRFSGQVNGPNTARRPFQSKEERARARAEGEKLWKETERVRRLRSLRDNFIYWAEKAKEKYDKGIDASAEFIRATEYQRQLEALEQESEQQP